MRSFFGTGDEPGFQKIIIISFILHLLFIAVAVVPFSGKKREIKNYYVNLVSPAAVRSKVRPKAVKSDKKAGVRTKRIPPKKNIKSKADMMLESSEVSTAIDKIQQKKREEEEKRAREKREEEERAQKFADLKSRIKEDASRVEEVVPEELPVAEDAPEVSNAPETSNLYAGIGVYDAQLLYEARLRAYFDGFWEKPKIDTEDLAAVFDVRVNKDWKIVSYRIVESSGSRLFDRSTLIAMQDAMKSTEFDPLPVPPLEMHNEVLNEGMEFTFHGKDIYR
jgi:outer membrane biosynthesis protein TonB